MATDAAARRVAEEIAEALELAMTPGDLSAVLPIIQRHEERVRAEAEEIKRRAYHFHEANLTPCCRRVITQRTPDGEVWDADCRCEEIKAAEAEAESLRAMLAEKQRLLDEDFWHKQYSQTHQALQDIEADLRAQVATLTKERDDAERSRELGWHTRATEVRALEAQLSEARAELERHKLNCDEGTLCCSCQVRWNHVNRQLAEAQQRAERTENALRQALDDMKDTRDFIDEQELDGYDKGASHFGSLRLGITAAEAALSATEEQSPSQLKRLLAQGAPDPERRR